MPRNATPQDDSTGGDRKQIDKQAKLNAYWHRATDPARHRRPPRAEMAEFLDYLERARTGPRPVRERSEVLTSLYGVLHMSVADGSERLTVTVEEIMWDVNGQPVGYFPYSGLESPTVRQLLQAIRQRDSMVRRHLGVAAETAEAITYRLTNDPHNSESVEAAPPIPWPRP